MDKFLEADEDETMHSGADVETFKTELNRDIEGNASASQQPPSDSDTESKMEPSVITKGRYTYVHDVKNCPPGAIDIHHIIVTRSSLWVLKLCKYALLLSIACLVILLLLQEKPVANVLWILTVAGLFLRQSLRKLVEKETVTIFPAFGVQLETVYRSGRIVCHFVPIGKILKPVLNECVTPVTCYWSLSLILHGEEELLLVFKESYPPVAMLVPIWKALCAAIDNEKALMGIQNVALDDASEQ